MGSRIKENPESTFEVYVEVKHPGVSGSNPEVRRQFPEDYIDQETLQTVCKFCFPFSADSLTVSQVGQNFTFVLTDIDSKQRFGFCRLSSGTRSCFCILSYLPWFEVFYKLLNILADYTIKGQENHWRELLEALHTLPVPEPGVPVHLSVHTYFTAPDLRELPSIPENRNLTEYFVAVDVNNMLHLYASMLYERRIIICCSKLSTLTACVHGSAAMLYPMYWQHVYIPVLPQHLLDYCCAPMPYLIGVHSSLMEKVKTMAIEDVVLLNVDTNTLETPFSDLQSLPNDVVSSLKNRLKKVSTTTGDGVARAFLKAQAALFGSYRNALRIEPEEPITFSEEAFVTHRSSAMRQFLQNAIQLQLFKQFIDDRLELLNSGEGFSDVFEEEINMGEYAGSDKNYHQWLSTVKKGSGALLNTVKTKANPAMKTVYKFAKDHARMGIKEVKSRLKQKELTENGFGTSDDTSTRTTSGSPATTRKESRTWDDRRPITVHFGQPARVPPPRPPPPKLQRSTRPARPPRPLVVKRPRSNMALDSCRTSASSPEQPQPYRSLKESELIEGEEEEEEPPGQTAPPTSKQDRLREVNLLCDIFGSLEDEPEGQPLCQAKSLEELRTPQAGEEPTAKFSYQRIDFSTAEHTRTLPGLGKSNPYNKLWSYGQDDMALPVRSGESRDKPESVPPPLPRRPPPPTVLTPDQTDSPSCKTITIPRPQGRKTPEPGKVLAPPVPQPRGTKLQTTDPGLTPGGQEFRQALSMPVQPASGELLQPHKVQSDSNSLDLLSLLDPLSSTPCPPTFPQTSLNPFAQPPYCPPIPISTPFGPHYTPTTSQAYFQPSSYAMTSPAFSPAPLLRDTPPPIPPKPIQPGEEARDRTLQDPFGELLAMSKQVAAPRKKEWETFE